MTEGSHNDIMKELGEIKGTLNTFIMSAESAAVVQDKRIGALENTSKDQGRTLNIHTGGIAVLAVLVTVGVPVIVKFLL